MAQDWVLREKSGMFILFCLLHKYHLSFNNLDYFLGEPYRLKYYLDCYVMG